MKIALDSRLIKPGEYFVPVKGEAIDGHKFIDQAIRNGAKGIIEERELYDLVRKKIHDSDIKIIGITGSNGKTTVAYLTDQLLSKKFSVALGKQNTRLGLAVDFINSVSAKTGIFVAEIGMDRLGEISETVELFPLDIAVITAINTAHLEKLKTQDNIAKAKFEISEGLKNGSSQLLLNYTDVETQKYVKNNQEKMKGTKVLWFGKPSDKEFGAPNLPGEHNRLNLQAVSSIADIMGMTSKEISESLPNLVLPKGRLNIIKGINGSMLIDDTYNANPTSTMNALQVLLEYRIKNGGNRTVAILGNMLELGENEESGHKDVAEKINELGIDVVITVGGIAEIIYNNANVKEKYKLAKSDDFPQLLDKLDISEDVALIKGSQGVRMEKITEMLMLEKDKAGKLLVRQDKRWK